MTRVQLKYGRKPPIMTQNVQSMVVHGVGDQNYGQNAEINLSGLSCAASIQGIPMRYIVP
jgi:hypothetical protein